MKTYLHESILSIADTGYALRFLKLLVTPWEKSSAYKEGLIDKKGKRLKDVKIETKQQKEAYTIFHRLVYNLKRLVGGSRFTSLVSALYLIKEETNLTDEQLLTILEDATDIKYDVTHIKEHFVIDNRLSKGTYKLVNNIASPITGEVIALSGTKIIVDDFAPTVDTILGYNIYNVKHIPTNQDIYITTKDITR
jgi:hypothetical protein